MRPAMWAFVGVLLLAGNCRAMAKCPAVFVEVHGRASEDVPGSHVSIQVSPSPNQLTEPVAIEGGRFTARIAFDTTKSGGRFSHDCSRTPEVVTVSLVVEQRELDRVRLEIGRDFRRTDSGDYTLLTDVTLRPAGS